MCMRVAAVTMETGLLIHVALLFINKVGGSKRGYLFSIRPASGTKITVRIIEVVLYTKYNSMILF